MKKMLIFVLALIVFPVVALAGVISPARMLLTEGDVMFRTPDSEEWLPASVNTPFDEGDAIWNPAESRCEVQLADGTMVRLDGDSQLDFIAVEEGFTHLHLASGKLYLKTSATAGKDSLQIDADDTTLLPDARTRLRIDMLPNSQEDVSIFKGSAYVEGNGSRTKVRAGEHIALEEEHNELLPLNPPDAWEQWNSERDRLKSRMASSDNNLPTELRAYAGELDNSGRWVSTPEYGMVWYPTVVLSADWAPYRSGRWVWKGDDYVWISYENWGWAPYHYGRWAVVGRFGWCWIPPMRGNVYWGPGYVGWYNSGSHIGWTPLAPGETFYGHRNYGPHSVNIEDRPMNSGVAVSYRNRHVRGGFSVVLQNDFLRGRTAFQSPSQSNAVSLSVSFGSPRIKPVRETRMPIVTHTPPRFTPPPARDRNAHELQTRFPRLIEKQRPGRPQAVPPTPAAQNGKYKKDSAPDVRHERVKPSTEPRTAVPSNRPERKERPQVPAQTDTHTSQQPTRHGEAQGQRTAPKEQKQKKVWKVRTADQGDEKDQRDKEGKGSKGRK
ncbi:MAG: FecR domain-containing protein [Desulfuromonadaceae bacterium]|nr:FecR domain-containing protein [Desulfuromonadaceae bacterium]MDD5106780.1 FecR domain-containing protein [Desulfuromonadaceae bacterium]